MKAIAAPTSLLSRQTILTRALSDPKVETLARSMNLDLRNPDTLNRLLGQAQEIVGETRVSLAGASSAANEGGLIGATSTQVARISDPRARQAIRTYLEIAALS